MKKSTPATADAAPVAPAPLPSSGGSYIRQPDGTLVLEARAAALEDPVQSPVKEA